MKVTCEQIRGFHAMPGEPGREAVEAHLALCPECRRREAAYLTALALGAQATAGMEGAEVFAATPAFLTRGRRRHAGRLALAVAACLAIAFLSGLLVRTGGISEAPAPTLPAPGLAEVQVPPQPPVGVEREVHGDPEAGTPIPPDGIVEARSDGVVLARPDVGSVELAPGARIRVEAWDGSRASLVLEAGRLEASVLPRAPGQRFEVRTEFAVVRVVGTRFSVTHLPGLETHVACDEGEVRVDSPSGAEIVRVTAGRFVRISPTAEEVPAVTGALPGDVRSRPRIGRRPASHPPLAPSPGSLRCEPDSRIHRLLAEGRAEAAIERIRAGLETACGDRARLLALLGDACRIAGRFDEAMRAYRDALAAGSATESLLVDLATLLQGPLGRPEEAEVTWRRCLDAFPRGTHAARALYETWALARARGDTAEAGAIATRLLWAWPDAPEAVRVLVDEGRLRMDAGDRLGADAWFQGVREANRTDLAEAALVGLMRIRREQGDVAAVRSLAEEHSRRFPEGARRDEVSRIMESMASGPEGGA